MLDLEARTLLTIKNFTKAYNVSETTVVIQMHRYT